ncbi:UNVERIFIED_CONTAM: hypothetical protein Sradi_3264700 [Sesamum radiatum]|uniref:Uncharacterized protein n=1 Tax=Sesamum radiatum TaxID=300843 RepID=A0AAW2QZM9_SESRA
MVASTATLFAKCLAHAMKLTVRGCIPLDSLLLKELIRLHNPGLVFISETKLKAKRCELIK